MQGKYGNLDASVVSYGPCQTPTLNFCVERHQCIAAFQPEPFWVVRPHVSKGGRVLDLDWARGRIFDLDVAQMFKKVVMDGKSLKVCSLHRHLQSLQLVFPCIHSYICMCIDSVMTATNSCTSARAKLGCNITCQMGF